MYAQLVHVSDFGTSGLPSAYPLGSTWVENFATDNTDNVGKCTTEARVSDIQPPVLDCGAGLATIALAEVWKAVATVILQPPAVSDNSGGSVALNVTVPLNATISGVDSMSPERVLLGF